MKLILPVLNLLLLLIPQGCTADSAELKSDPHSVSTTASPAPVQSRDKLVSMNAQEVMNRVAKRYSSLKFYSCHGKIIHRANFDGKEEAPVETDFEFVYDRVKGSGSIEWVSAGHNKKFSFDRKTSTTSEDGKVTGSFSTLSEGLTSIDRSEAGLTLFQLDVFVFRDELKMGDVFFAALRDATVSDECELDGRACYLLSGKTRNVDAVINYWVDKEDFVLRKMERVIYVRKKTPEKTYLRTTTMTEQYTDIQIR